MQLSNEITKFLKSHFGCDYSFESIRSDASLRSYYRIFHNGESYILMDSSREISSMIDFIKISKILENINQRSPKIFAKEEENGLLIIEDFGSDIVNKIIKNSNEEDLYKKIIDVLIEMGKYPNDSYKNEKDFPDFKSYLLDELEIFIKYYLSFKEISFSHEKIQILKNFFDVSLTKISSQKQVLVLADYHVDNLFLLEDGSIGLIDYQDALLGSSVYDLVSVLQDARRFINFAFADKMVEYYSKMTGQDLDEVIEFYHILGLQRNIRILGIFARKAILEGDCSYIKNYEPILKKYINHSIKFVSDNEFKILIESI